MRGSPAPELFAAPHRQAPPREEENTCNDGVDSTQAEEIVPNSPRDHLGFWREPERAIGCVSTRDHVPKAVPEYPLPARAREAREDEGCYRHESQGSCLQQGGPELEVEHGQHKGGGGKPDVDLAVEGAVAAPDVGVVRQAASSDGTSEEDTKTRVEHKLDACTSHVGCTLLLQDAQDHGEEGNRWGGKAERREADQRMRVPMPRGLEAHTGESFHGIPRRHSQH
mmetsp:Transcript_38480/g.86776  ORF Transcript_38480/g.86776 Transcript_38480/m.86776 type:complete len:225 (+) Transcript_38480:240-914(+)